MSEELQDIAPLPIEERISNELVKHNVTEAIIAKLREDYLPLKIAGIDDKETYLLVKEARKKCKEIRVLAKKICVDGREDAVAIQKAWVAKEKDVTGRIGEVEDYLEKQEKEYEAAVAKEKEDRKRRQEEQLIMRQQVLTGMGALYSDGSFHLGEVSFELSVVKESEPDIWEESILPKFKEEYAKVEAERIEQERIKKEQEAEFMRRELEQERKRLELEAKEAALKRAQEEQERKQKKEEDERLAAERARQRLMIEGRCNKLVSLGMVTNTFPTDRYFYGEIQVSMHWIETATEDAWAETIEEITPKILGKKEAAEQKRLAEIEAQKEKQRISDLRKHRCDLLMQYGVVDYHEDVAIYDDEKWASLLEDVKGAYEEQQRLKWEKEQEEKRKQEELKKQLEMEQAKDKEKWEEIIRRVNEIEVYEMRSSQYRKKAMILREKLEEIKAL